MAHRPCDCLLKGLIYVLLWIQSLLKAIIVRVSFGGGAFAPPSWNLLANMHTTITLYVTCLEFFKFTFCPLQ